jgi:beta-phosphoglucomutase-like phosphatase (HAD superfamily)
VAACAFAHRDSWLKPYQRIDILRKLAQLMDGRRDHLSRQIASEGGKPLTDAIVETDRAIDGVRNAIEILRNSGGREVPMGITPASDGRWAFTIREPIGDHRATDRDGRNDLMHDQVQRMIERRDCRDDTKFSTSRSSQDRRQVAP